MNLQNIIDLHIHTSPDVRPRRMDDLEQAATAAKVGARAIVLKSHFCPTAERAAIAQQRHPQLSVLGGVALNRTVGGLNPHAVRHTLQMGGKIVWLPTLHARNHHRLIGKPGGLEVIDHQGRPKQVLLQIIDLVLKHQAVLATGHISQREIVAVLQAAIDRGLDRLLINHPEHAVTNLSLQQQADLQKRFPVFFERCYSQPLPNGSYRKNLQTNLAAIKELGHERTIISSDLGQQENPLWQRGMQEYLDYLVQHGVTDQQIRHMCQQQPAALLGLEPAESGSQFRPQSMPQRKRA